MRQRAPLLLTQSPFQFLVFPVYSFVTSVVNFFYHRELREITQRSQSSFKKPHSALHNNSSVQPHCNNGCR